MTVAMFPVLKARSVPFLAVRRLRSKLFSTPGLVTRGLAPNSLDAYARP